MTLEATTVTLMGAELCIMRNKPKDDGRFLDVIFINASYCL